MKNKFYIVPLLISVFLFSSCGGNGEEPTNGTTIGKKLYETNDFSIQIPQDWNIIEKSQFTSNVPPETVVVFRNNIKSDIFTANLNINRVALPSEISSSDFAKSNMESARTNLLNFQEISGVESTLPYGGGSINIYISEFSGKKTATESTVNFKQFFVTKSTTGYIVTAAYIPSEDESVVKYLDEMLNSFSLK